MGRHFDFKPGGRFIPTCVGRMGCRDELTFGTTGSSPRAWGEWPKSPSAPVLSPVHPHLRGANLQGLCPPGRYVRFIPTCVGRITGSLIRLRPKGGSSPRAWGESPDHPQILLGHRFIPTGVGRIPEPGHRFVVADGSSPRAWGEFNDRAHRHAIRPVHPHVRGANALRGLPD